MRRSGRSKEDDDEALSEELQEFVAEKPAEDKSDEIVEEKPAKDDKSGESTEKKICTCAVNVDNDEKKTTDVAAKADQVKTIPISAAGSHLITKRITIAGGFLDIALFTANCEQLKFVLELGNFHIYYNEVLALLITSLVLQLLIGVTMFLIGCQVTQKASDETYFNFLNHTTMGLVAIITIINIFIGTFGPKGTVMARCLGAFAYPNTYGSLWKNYINATRHYMAAARYRIG